MKNQKLRSLIIEDSEDDTLLLIRELKKGGFHVEYERVETAVTMEKALREKKWDIILCDYKMPKFDGASAISLLKETKLDLPIIIISGTIGEETAVECMRLGAQDYLMKGKLSRLCSAIKRELEDARIRRRHKQTEEALHQSEEKYKTMLDNMQEGYYEIDLSGRFTFFNDAMCKNLGCSPNELMNMDSRQYAEGEDLSDVLRTFNSVYITGKPVKEHCWRVKRKDGSQRYMAGSISLKKDSSGKPIGFRALARDITERKQEEMKLQQTLESLKKAVGTTIQVLVSALESRDPYTAGHQARVAHLACAVAEEMGLDKERIDGIRLAGCIHDIGKLSIPAEILSKPTKLTNLEFSLIKEHPRSGYEMLKHVESPWPLADIVHQHHERINGSGYPGQLKGDEIILEARIMAVADVVEAMASHRPYRASLGVEAALEEIRKNKGIIFDSAVVDACLNLFTVKSYNFP